MARSLCQTIFKIRPNTKPTPSSSLILSSRSQSSQPNHFDQPDASSDASSDPLLRKLEDAIHRIIVRRSAPDWLPFLPGSSYWVPPSTAKSYGLAQIVEKLANPLTLEESMSTTTVRGWPSSEYFIKGGAPHRVEEADMTSNTKSKTEEG
ncbi:Serine/arginine repetitive matrix protein 2 [Hibiscus syriacus]|uniref:Serine/arginine repetitive matrix protein 2 n=1 Tax=Hibiscus syriacus TaxID=106335 RepID=A0A6A2YF78_HIBSY|nr:uncharacterized protein LOC120170589 isoform X2 [Hibiscus syriacus]KAE8673407.1 Serine/arginine repetitive matrix protein 2 [Hibiscus syriacus]